MRAMHISVHKQGNRPPPCVSRAYVPYALLAERDCIPS